MTEGLVMSYPSRLKQKYDPVVARMSKSLRSGTGFQTPGTHESFDAECKRRG
jgi:hypothetical protein